MKKVILVIIGLGVAFLGFGAIVGNTPEGKERSKDRAVIDLCWKDQGKRSNSAQVARLTAEVCEGLESSYRQKHGRNP